MYHSTYRSKLSYPPSTTISTEYRWTLPRSHLCKYNSILSRCCAAGRSLLSHRWVQQPLPAWLFGDMRSHSNALRAADESSMTESDTKSVTDSDYSFGTEPAI